MATKTITVKNDVTVKVTTSVQTFTVAFNATNHVYYEVIWTNGGLGTAPENLAKRKDAYTYTDVPYGAQYKVNYISDGYYTASPTTGVVVSSMTISAPSESYNDYYDHCGCGNE